MKKKLLITLGLIVFILLPLFVVYGTTDESDPGPVTPTSGLEEIQKDVVADGGFMPAGDPVLIIVRIFNYILTFIGVIFLLMIIYGGYTWMTAAGNEEKIKKGKGLLQTAVIGLVIVVLARVFYIFIQDRLKDFTK